MAFTIDDDDNGRGAIHPCIHPFTERYQASASTRRRRISVQRIPRGSEAIPGRLYHHVIETHTHTHSDSHICVSDILYFSYKVCILFPSCNESISTTITTIITTVPHRQPGR